MSRRAVLLGVLLVGCGRDAEVTQQWQRALPESWTLGEAVDATLIRSWPEEWRASGFDAGLLEPLEVEELGVARTTRVGRVRELRRLRLRAWQTGALTIPLPFAAQNPATEESIAAASADLVLQVQSVLGPDDSGQMESAPPIPVIASPWGKRPFAALSVVILYGLVVTWVARSRGRTEQTATLRWDPWDNFAQIQAMPRETSEQRAAVRSAARELLRALEPGRAWGGDELAWRVSRRYALPATEAASLRALVAACEQSLFAEGVDPAPLDPELDELAEVLQAVEEVRG